MRGSFVVFVFRNITLQLRRIMASYAFEIAPLTFAGRLSHKVREALWEALKDGQYEATMLYSSNSCETGFVTRVNGFSEYHISNLEGALLAVRRTKDLPLHRKILGKTLPNDYALVNHLVDTAGVASVIWECALSQQQKSTITEGLGVSSKQAKSLIMAIAGLHDIGKAHGHWQPTLGVRSGHYSLESGGNANPLETPEIVDDQIREHQLAGAVFFSDPNNGTSIESPDLQLLFSKIVWAHHGVFSSDNLNEIVRVKGHLFNDAGWFSVRQDIEQDILSLLQFNEADFSEIWKCDNATITLITGIVILADWVASRSSFILSAPDSGAPLSEILASSQERARAFFREHGVASAVWKKDISWETIFPEFNPNSLQESILSLFTTPVSDSLAPTTAIEPAPGDSGGILVVTAPMGSGKTEGALAAASLWGKISGASGIWVTLPTQATSELMFERAIQISKKVFEGKEHSISLMHGNASISTAIEGKKVKGLAQKRLAFSAVDDHEQMEAETPSSAQQDSSLFISSFLVEKKLGGMAGMTVSTVDQAISASLRIKHTPLRWLGASGNVVILDEVHDFDAYTFSLILKFVAWAGALNMPIIAMSATLSGESQRALINAYWSGKSEVNRMPIVSESLASIPAAGIPSPSWVFAGSVPGSLRFSGAIPMPVESTPYNARLLVSESFTSAVKSRIDRVVVEQKGQLLVVCNTVAQSIGVAETLERAYGNDFPVILLHSRLMPAHKEKIIDDILKRSGKQSGSNGRHPYILVSTQIVEQSMDIDFDCLVSALAPLDSCLQRVGRIHRHDQQRSIQSAPEVDFIVHPNVLKVLNEGVPDSPTLTGFSPYSYWEILATLEVLKAFLPITDIEGEYYPIAFKDDLGLFFEKYSEIKAEIESGNARFSLLAAHQQMKGIISSMETSASVAEIPNPLFSAGSWSRMTTRRTPRSIHAPSTRLINDFGMHNIVLVDGNTAENMHILRRKLQFLDRHSIQKLCGKATISFRIDLIPEEAIIDKEKLPLEIPDHITLVSLDVLKNHHTSIVYTDRRGLYNPSSLDKAWL